MPDTEKATKLRVGIYATRGTETAMALRYRTAPDTIRYISTAQRLAGYLYHTPCQYRAAGSTIRSVPDSAYRARRMIAAHVAGQYWTLHSIRVEGLVAPYARSVPHTDRTQHPRSTLQDHTTASQGHAVVSWDHTVGPYGSMVAFRRSI
eukprot:1520398-Rhodomonas_salina.2